MPRPGAPLPCAGSVQRPRGGGRQPVAAITASNLAESPGPARAAAVPASAIPVATASVCPAGAVSIFNAAKLRAADFYVIGVKAGASRHRYAADGLDRLAPARQRLLMQVRLIGSGALPSRRSLQSSD